MLVNQIIAEESVEMIVPDLTDPKTREMGDDERLTVNIQPEDYSGDRQIGELNIPGNATLVKVGIKDFSLDQMDEVTAALKEAKAANEKIEVMLRADGAIYYDEIQPVMQAIASAGIVKVNLVAFLPEDLR